MCYVPLRNYPPTHTLLTYTSIEIHRVTSAAHLIPSHPSAACVRMDRNVCVDFSVRKESLQSRYVPVRRVRVLPRRLFLHSPTNERRHTQQVGYRRPASIHQIKSNQIKFISKCKNSAHSKHVMHLGGTARRIALTAAQCYSFIYK